MKLSRKRRARIILAAVTAAVLCGGRTAGAESYISYTYDWYSNPVPGAACYSSTAVVYGTDISGEEWTAPADIAACEDFIALLDSGNSASGIPGSVWLTDRDYKLIRRLTYFDNGGREDCLTDPQGLFISPSGELYIADTGAGRIVRLTAQGELIAEYGRPETAMLDDIASYQPQKLCVDDAGRMYIIATAVNQGLIELEEDGAFLRFMGANAVQYNIAEYIWRFFSTEAQLGQMELFVPTEYANLSIDSSGFVFAVNGTSSETAADSRTVRRLNPKGNDVLKANGYIPPVGDILNEKIYSVMVDVDVHPSGIYAVLDSNSGRVFVYDPDGNMLSAFSGKGEQEGMTQVPKAVCYSGDKLIVLDSFRKAVLEFSLTPYGEAVQLATELYESGSYEESGEQWREVLRKNANSDLAYTGIGLVALRTGDYESAITNFRLAEQRQYYSRAYKLYRREWLSVYFPYAAVGIIAAVGLILLIRAVKKAVAFYIRLGTPRE